MLPGDHPPVIPTLAPGTYPDLVAGTVAYAQGQKVLRDGLPYQAKYYTKGDDPSAVLTNPAGSPWQALYTIPGEPPATVVAAGRLNRRRRSDRGGVSSGGDASSASDLQSRWRPAASWMTAGARASCSSLEASSALAPTQKTWLKVSWTIRKKVSSRAAHADPRCSSDWLRLTRYAVTGCSSMTVLQVAGVSVRRGGCAASDMVSPAAWVLAVMPADTFPVCCRHGQLRWPQAQTMKR